MSEQADAPVTTLHVRSLKVALPLAPDQVPRGIDPADPRLRIDLDGLSVAVRLNPKAIRKLKAHPHGVVLQGRLTRVGSVLTLEDAGFQFLEPRAATGGTAPTEP